MSFLISLLALNLIAGTSADCFDQVMSDHETDIDCGGPDCWTRCATGMSCTGNTDCVSGVCVFNVCVGTSRNENSHRTRIKAVEHTYNCYNFLKDDDEADIDCGGPHCWERCPVGKSCQYNSDCTSGYCEDQKCALREYSRILSASGGSGTSSGPSPSPSSSFSPSPSPIGVSPSPSSSGVSSTSPSPSSSAVSSTSPSPSSSAVSSTSPSPSSSGVSSTSPSPSSSGVSSISPSPSSSAVSSTSPSPSSSAVSSTSASPSSSAVSSTSPSPSSSGMSSSSPSSSTKVVKEKITLESTLTIAGLEASDFGVKERNDLAKSIADALDLSEDRVIVEKIINVGESTASSVRRLQSHASGIIVLYSVTIAEANEVLNKSLLTNIKGKMESFDENVGAVDNILDQIAESTGKERSTLSLSSGKVIETKGDPIQCKKNEKVVANSCVSCPWGQLNPAGDFASGPDTQCKKSVEGSGNRGTNVAVIGMILVGIAFVFFVGYEVYKAVTKTRKMDIGNLEMTKV